MKNELEGDDMKKETRIFVDHVHELFAEQDEKQMHINYILSKREEDYSLTYLCIASSKLDPDDIRMVSMTPENQVEYQHVFEWDFNIDDYILTDLEKGFLIEYMPLEEHYNMWCAIEEWAEDIEHKDGLYAYLDHCKRNGITQKEISLIGHDPIDVMNHYREKNENYEILNETVFGKKSIVLGYNPKAPSPYVTWKTSLDRYRGFDLGHYFSDFNEAYDDYKERCHEMLDDHLKTEKKKLKSKNKEQHFR